MGMEERIPLKMEPMQRKEEQVGAVCLQHWAGCVV